MSNFVVAARQLRNHLLKQTRLAVHLFPSLVKLNENRNLRTENFRYKRFCQVIDGPQRVTFRDMLLRFVDGGQKNDRSVTGLLTFADQCGCFETVDHRHIDIENDEREFQMKQISQGVNSGLRADQVLSKVAQECFECDEVFDVIVDQQDIDLLIGHAFIL